MAEWIARYEEGYVTDVGETMTMTDELRESQTWGSPAAAMEHWRGRKELAEADVSAYGNGLQQFDDVSARAEFARLGVVRIWRRITFVPQAAAVPDYGANTHEIAAVVTDSL